MVSKTMVGLNVFLSKPRIHPCHGGWSLYAAKATICANQKSKCDDVFAKYHWHLKIVSSTTLLTTLP
jgi:hypothetical protein